MISEGRVWPLRSASPAGVSEPRRNAGSSDRPDQGSEKLNLEPSREPCWGGATGITAYLKNGGTLEKAAMIANHASTRTTQLYDRRNDEVSLDEVERILI